MILWVFERDTVVIATDRGEVVSPQLPRTFQVSRLNFQGNKMVSK
jgi:hypothetical protein